MNAKVTFAAGVVFFGWSSVSTWLFKALIFPLNVIDITERGRRLRRGLAVSFMTTGWQQIWQTSALKYVFFTALSVCLVFFFFYHQHIVSHACGRARWALARISFLKTGEWDASSRLLISHECNHRLTRTRKHRADTSNKRLRVSHKQHWWGRCHARVVWKSP